jgi:RND family efflux transporter MFP subunit
MIEIAILYVLICYILIKVGFLQKTIKTYIGMASVGLLILIIIFLASRYYAFIDLTKSATVYSKQIALRTPSGGDIEKVYVENNQRVKKGDLIYKYDTERYDIQMRTYQASLKAETAVLDNLRKDLERIKKLKSGGFASLSEYENNQINLFKQEEMVTKLEQSISDLQWKIDRSVVLSPVDGYLNIVYLSEGQYFPETRMVTSINIFTDKKFLQVRIPDQVYTFIKVGAFVEFYLNTHPGKIFRGRVQSISQSTGEAQGSLINMPQNVSGVIAKGSKGIGRIVIVDFIEPEGVTIPLGANGQVWIAAEKPHILGFLDLIAGIMLRAGAIEAYLGAFH